MIVYQAQLYKMTVVSKLVYGRCLPALPLITPLVPLQYTVFPRLEAQAFSVKVRIAPRPGERVGARFAVRK